MTNPMGLVVEALTKYVGLENVIGICENIPSYRRMIANLLKVEESSLSI